MRYCIEMECSFFTKTRFPSTPRSFLVIDIDGTLVTNGAYIVGETTHNTLSWLKKCHIICLTSNNKNRKRNEAIALTLGFPYVAGIKPFGKITNAVRAINSARLPIIVVGDRYSTDGLLARRLKGVFIPVKSLRNGNESWHTKIAYVLDAMIARIMRAISLCLIILQ